MAEVFSPDLSQGYGQTNIIDMFNKPSQIEQPAQSMDRDTKMAIAKSAQSSGASGGGLGGMLTSGGMTAGLMGAGPAGWATMGGGLVLSAIENKKKESAAREQQAIDNEMTKRNSLIQLARDASNQDFRLA